MSHIISPHVSPLFAHTHPLKKLALKNSCSSPNLEVVKFPVVTSAPMETGASPGADMASTLKRVVPSGSAAKFESPVVR